MASSEPSRSWLSGVRSKVSERVEELWHATGLTQQEEAYKYQNEASAPICEMSASGRKTRSAAKKESEPPALESQHPSMEPLLRHSMVDSELMDTQVKDLLAIKRELSIKLQDREQQIIALQQEASITARRNQDLEARLSKSKRKDLLEQIKEQELKLKESEDFLRKQSVIIANQKAKHSDELAKIKEDFESARCNLEEEKANNKILLAKFATNEPQTRSAAKNESEPPVLESQHPSMEPLLGDTMVDRELMDTQVKNLLAIKRELSTKLQDREQLIIALQQEASITARRNQDLEARLSKSKHKDLLKQMKEQELKLKESEDYLRNLSVIIANQKAEHLDELAKVKEDFESVRCSLEQEKANNKILLAKLATNAGPQLHPDSDECCNQVCVEKQLLLNKLLGEEESSKIKVDSLQKLVENWKETCDEVIKERDEARNAVAIAKAEADIFKADFEEERRDREKAQGELEAYTNKKKYTTIMNERTAELRQDVATQKDLVKKQKMEIAKLKTELQSTKDVLNGMMHKVEDQTREFELEVHSYKKSMKEMKSELEKNITELNGARKECNELKNQMVRLESHEIKELKAVKTYLNVGSYGSVSIVQVNGVYCIEKRLHESLLGQGLFEKVSNDQVKPLLEKFYNECQLLWKMHHPNIVQFLGIHYYQSDEKDKLISLVMEYLPTNMDKCIEICASNQYVIPFSIKLSILRDILCGLSHLHSNDIIHRDLSAANVLLSTAMRAKIADLGVSKIINDSKHTIAPGAQYIMPPEACYGDYTLKLDIFSFGIISLYLMIQKEPNPVKIADENYRFPEHEMEIRKREIYINQVKADHKVIGNIITCCLMAKPEARPTAKKITTDVLIIYKQFLSKFLLDVSDFTQHVGKKVFVLPEDY